MADPKIFYLLHRSYRAAFKAADRILLREFDITTAQNSLLLYLDKHEGATMGAVATALGLGNAATSGLVDRTIKKGLIRREASAEDGRSFELFLCDTGRDIAAHSKILIKAANDRLMEGFDTGERDIIERFLLSVAEKADAMQINVQ